MGSPPWAEILMFHILKNNAMLDLNKSVAAPRTVRKIRRSWKHQGWPHGPGDLTLLGSHTHTLKAPPQFGTRHTQTIRELVDLLEDPVAQKKNASVADAAGSDESDDNADLALQWDLGTGAPCWNSGPDLFLGEL